MAVFVRPVGIIDINGTMMLINSRFFKISGIENPCIIYQEVESARPVAKVLECHLPLTIVTNIKIAGFGRFSNFIRQCFQKIGCDKDVLIRGDVFRFLKSCGQKFDLIFADPPYSLPELPTLPQLILDRELLTSQGILVFEHGKQHDFSSHADFLEHRSYGSVNFSLFHPVKKEEGREEEAPAE